jgi:hypothetical protein
VLEIGLARTLSLPKGGTLLVNTANLIGRLGKFNVISRKDCFTSHAGSYNQKVCK